MESIHEQVELLKAAIVLAAADQVISPSERGLLTALAGRIGVGKVSLDAMIERALSDPAAREELFRRTMSDPEKAMELLVATARLDGEVADAEREVLAQIMQKLGISVERFADLYERGMQRADALRKAKFG